MVEKIKDNDKFRRDYAAMNLHDRDIQRTAKKEGAQAKAVENAINFLRMKLGTIEQIAQVVGLSVEEVIALKNEINTKNN